MNSSKELYIIIVDIKSKEISNLFNRIDFEIYLNKENQFKDFDYYCYNHYITISTPIKNKDFINLNLAKNFNKQGYDIFNLSSEFYNDICASINVNDSDLILKDRIEYIYPTNISFCPYGCRLNYIDVQNERFNCSCTIPFTSGYEGSPSGMGFDFDREKLINSITLKYNNFDILKCFNVLFNKKNLNYNIGSYLLLFIILIYIIGVFLFYCKEYKNFFNRIQLLIKNILEDKNKIDNTNNTKFLSVKKIKETNTKKPIDISISPKSKDSNIDIIEKSSQKRFNWYSQISSWQWKNFK